ncbi:MAG: pyridoxamine 5'-phosphate oxidase [Desulfobulbus propionicus]|nr:MAG: pyridoxamine 5'-phosphate oxidase [Desulfobulbus propionicus]
MDINSLRKNYSRFELSRKMLAPDPIHQFEGWFEEAREKIDEANAMVLATVDSLGQPYQRTVLLKFFDKKGFVFFTNYRSSKARHIQTNQKVSLLFPWLKLERQVIVHGKAEKNTIAESARYFATRPRDSQLGAWISNQSSPISSRSILLNELEKAKIKFSTGRIPLPDFWGGYRVIPQSIEFWQGREGRLHDRFLYRREEAGQWSISRLAP